MVVDDCRELNASFATQEMYFPRLGDANKANCMNSLVGVNISLFHILMSLQHQNYITLNTQATYYTYISVYIYIQNIMLLYEQCLCSWHQNPCHFSTCPLLSLVKDYPPEMESDRNPQGSVPEGRYNWTKHHHETRLREEIHEIPSWENKWWKVWTLEARFKDSLRFAIWKSFSEEWRLFFGWNEGSHCQLPLRSPGFNTATFESLEISPNLSLYQLPFLIFAPSYFERIPHISKSLPQGSG